MADELQYDPSSFAYQEGALGEVPTSIRLFTFRIHGGNGAPSASLGATGDFYLRKDGGGAGATHVYFNNAGWIGIA